MKILLSLLFSLMVIRAAAQAPESFSYQAVARDINGDLLNNQDISLHISILEGADGPEVYGETHMTTTNDIGLFSIKIGRGDVLTGEFENIDWSSGNKFLSVDMDPEGGNNFISIGIIELLSVPYALYAANSGGDNDQDEANELQDLKLEGDSLSLTLLDSPTVVNLASYVRLTEDEVEDFITNDTIDLAPGSTVDGQLINDWNSLQNIPDDISDGDSTGAHNLSQLLAGGNAANSQIKQVSDPTEAQDVVTKSFMDNLLIMVGDPARLLDVGYTLQQLINSDRPLEDLLKAGITQQELLDANVPEAEVANAVNCDMDFEIDTESAYEAAKAIGLCYGLETAEWVLPDGGNPTIDNNFKLGHGILSAFGSNVNPLKGESMLALSTGTARTPLDPGYSDDLNKGYVNNFPSGFPGSNEGCLLPTNAYDGIALKVALSVPEGATGISFSFKYYTKDFPTNLCSSFNDQAAVMLGTSTNILLDGSGNFVDVNSEGTIKVCDPGGSGYVCELGTDDLSGTGFSGNAASDWQTVTAGVSPGTITLTFAIWDSGDNAITSTLLVDDFKWLTD